MAARSAAAAMRLPRASATRQRGIRTLIMLHCSGSASSAAFARPWISSQRPSRYSASKTLPKTRQILVGKPDCSPGLRHVLAPILQTWTPAPPERPRRALRTPVRETRYGPEHIPGFLQEDWYRGHFAHIRGINPLHLRRAAAIFLCQIAVGGSLPHAAKLLGTPIARAERSGRVLCRWARDSTEPRQFETALLDLADELDSSPHLINYQRRREALNSWSIGPSTWQQLLRQLDPAAVHTPQELGDQGRRAATISVWARITQGDHPLAWRRSFGSSWILSQPGRLTHCDVYFQGILDQYADELATRIDRREFP